jgi:hypothetical protein
MLVISVVLVVLPVAMSVLLVGWRRVVVLSVLPAV